MRRVCCPVPAVCLGVCRPVLGCDIGNQESDGAVTKHGPPVAAGGVSQTRHHVTAGLDTGTRASDKDGKNTDPDYSVPQPPNPSSSASVQFGVDLGAG